MSMPLVMAHMMLGAVCLMIVLLHSAIGLRTRQTGLHLKFALLALSMGVMLLIGPRMYQATTVEAFAIASKWAYSFRVIGAISMVWFLAHYADFKQRAIPLLLTSIGGVILIVHWLSPFGFQYQVISGLRSVRLPWGETIVAVESITSGRFIFANLTGVGLQLFAIGMCLRLWRCGQKGRSVTLAIGLAPLILVAMPHGWLVDRGILNPPHLYGIAFFGLILLMSFRLVGEAVRTVELAREVEAEQRRWRSFLEKVRLVVVGLDANGRINYANPFTTTVSGYQPQELQGRHILEFQPATEREGVQQDLDRAIGGEALSQVVRPMTTKTGDQRWINWSAVALENATGTAIGILTIGADVTKQVEAEAARDKSMKELAELKARLEEENLYLKEEIQAVQDVSSNIIGQSDSVRYVLHKIQQVTKTSATVLIEGETGVGKELVARAIHEGSSRANGPFIRVNCGALPPTLVESELFGHEKGSFTGADRQRKGRFELAEGGSLFLDEIGELPMEIQSKLLRVLQESEFERVGDSRTRKADVRIIAATNRDLKREVAAGRFREDLFYRLRVYPITVPPLRERREDIPLLVKHFVGRLANRHGKTIKEVSAQMLRGFTEWNWPGNVRELENVVERAVITSNGPVLKLPSDFGTAPQAEGSSPAQSVARSLVDVERQHILGVLESTGGRIAGPGGAAEILDVHPNTLRSRMQKLGLLKSSRSA